MEDDHVDRPDVEARQRVQLTGTNRSIGLIALIFNDRLARTVLHRPVCERGAVGNRQQAIVKATAQARLPTAPLIPFYL